MDNFNDNRESEDNNDRTGNTTTATYTLGKIKQLIDLNGDSVNFEVYFTVKCNSDNDSFYMLVVDQATLDQDQPIQYKKVTNGGISGKVISDTNSYLNYFLILKADKECSVQVEITKRELDESEINIIPQEPIEDVETQQMKGMDQQLNQQLNQQLDQQLNQQLLTEQLDTSRRQFPQSSVNWKKIIIVCAIVGTGLGLYYYFTKVKKDKKESKMIEHDIISEMPSSRQKHSKSPYNGHSNQAKSIETKSIKTPNIPIFKSEGSEKSSSNKMSNYYKSFAKKVQPVKKQEITSIRSSDSSSSQQQVVASSLIERLKNARKNRK